MVSNNMDASVAAFYFNKPALVIGVGAQRVMGELASLIPLFLHFSMKLVTDFSMHPDKGYRAKCCTLKSAIRKAARDGLPVFNE